MHPPSLLYRDIGCFCNIAFIYLHGTFSKRGYLWACHIQFFWECKGRPVCLPSIPILSSYFGVWRPWLCKERSRPNINRWTWAIMLRNREDPYEASWCTLNHSFQSTHKLMMEFFIFLMRWTMVDNDHTKPSSRKPWNFEERPISVLLRLNDITSKWVGN